MREAAHDALAFIVLWTVVGSVTLTLCAVGVEQWVKPWLFRRFTRKSK